MSLIRTIAEVLVIILGAVIGPNVCGQSPSLPSWLSGHENLLPPITTNEFETIAKAWPHLCVEGRFRNEDDWQAFSTVASMGDHAEFALVWLYAQNKPIGYLRPYRRSQILEKLYDDSVSEPWLIPLLRHRVKWIGEHFNELQLIGDELTDLCSELGAIQGYVNARGLESDLNAVMSLVEALAKSNDTIRSQLSPLLEPEYSKEGRKTGKRGQKTGKRGQCATA